MCDEGRFEREQLHFAALQGDLPLVESLVAQGDDVDAFDEFGMTPLHNAAERGHLAVAAFLIRSGADVNAHHEPSIGNTPLRHVADACSLEMARLSVEGGADPLIRGWMQIHALDMAGWRCDAEGPSVQALLAEAAGRTA